jgi:UDP-N-acetylglucosamine--N-acetylmuramyl-(pentapeptide) pyrophosphoryl-undecaprenol N-acetylglucosamine transferase
MALGQRPDVVLATGGYASAAPALAAAMTRRPVWLQEQNSVPGSTNRLLGHLCERVYIAFESARAAFAGSVHLAPNPVRRSVRESVGRGASAEDHAAFGLLDANPTVLIFGGSRGAATLNRAFREAWPALRDANDWQYLVQTGEQEWESTRAVVDQDDDGASRARVLPFIDDMAAAWRVADIVVCRAGAMTLAELAVVGRPAILVPFPHATDDHQTRNAQELVAVGAARCVADAEFDGPRLLLELQALQESRPDRESIARAARAWGGERDGAVEIAEALIARAEGGRAA